jgi:hypothetical protein
MENDGENALYVNARPVSSMQVYFISPARGDDMARQYAPRAILRHLPLELIRTFISQQSIPTSLDWDCLTEGDTNALYQAWCNLIPEHRERIEMMLRQVHEMASEAGVRAMICEAQHRGQDIADPLASIDGHHAKALWVLIHHGPAFHTARQLLAAASPVGRFWNLTTGFSGQQYDTSPQALLELRQAVAQLYREQGRGHRCSIEHHERERVFYVFLYLDDYTQTHTAHDNRGKLTRSPLRPAFEVVYVYTREAGTLDMYARGDRRWRATLCDRFCEHILHTTAPLATPGRRSYQLNGLIDRTFPLTTDPARGILSATIRRLRIVAVEDLSRRVTLEANPTKAEDVYDMLDIHFPVERFPRDSLLVNLVTFTVHHVLAGEERALTFDVSFPDACNLKSLSHDHREVGEWCLRQWGILNDEIDEGEPDDDFADEERAA